VTSKSAFSSLTAGSYSTDLYATSSTYGDPGKHTFRGVHQIDPQWEQPDGWYIYAQGQLRVGPDAAALMRMSFSNCDAGAAPKQLQLSFSKGDYQNVSNAVCTFSITVGQGLAYNGSVCGESRGKTLSVLLDEVLTETAKSSRIPKIYLSANYLTNTYDADHLAEARAAHEAGAVASTVNSSYSNVGPIAPGVGLHCSYPHQSVDNTTQNAWDRFVSDSESYLATKAFLTSLKDVVSSETLDSLCQMASGPSAALQKMSGPTSRKK